MDWPIFKEHEQCNHLAHWLLVKNHRCLALSLSSCLHWWFTPCSCVFLFLIILFIFYSILCYFSYVLICYPLHCAACFSLCVYHYTLLSVKFVLALQWRMLEHIHSQPASIVYADDCKWLQALAHLGQVAVSVICTARAVATCPNACTIPTLIRQVKACYLWVAKHNNSNHHPFSSEVWRLLHYYNTIQ